jgi:predicted transcriptional regulator
LILSGEKQVELRRQRPRINSGPALIYASAPTMAIVASFQIESVKQVPLVLLWQSVRDIAGVSRQEFDDYFEGLETGVAIRIADVTEFRQPILLSELRRSWPGFQPPQSFRYVDQSEADKIGFQLIHRRVA